MDYQKQYQKLVETRTKLNRKKGDGNYYEKHHIIPKACGGSNEKENLILLTFKEHYIAHLLLTKIYNGELGRKMYFALWRMAYVSSKMQRVLSASQYQKCKEACRLASSGVKQSPEHIAKRVAKQIGLKHPHSEETKQKIKDKMKGKNLGNSNSEEAKEKRDITRASKKYVISEETREKMRQAKLGKIHSEETKQKIKKGNEGKIISEEQKEKMRATRLKNKILKDKN